MNNTAQRAITEGDIAMAGGNYDAALGYYQLSVDNGVKDPEITEKIDIIEDYTAALDEFDNNNIEVAKNLIDSINKNYTSYSISKDIDKLKAEINEQESETKEIDDEIQEIETLLSKGEYDEVLSAIDEIENDGLSDSQKKQVKNLKKQAETANSKINSAKNKSENSKVVYVPQNPPVSENKNVVATYYVANCNEYITLRSAPSTSASAITRIPLGKAVGYIENTGNGFYKVNYDGAVGYALAQYLSANKQTNNSVTYSTARVVNCNEWITLRSAPSTSAADLAHIPLGAYVTYLGSATNGFYYIEYNGMKGYGLQSYLKLQ